MAGVERFDKYGSLNIIDSLAEGNILNYDKVLKVEVATAHAKLMLEQDRREFQKRLNEIDRREAESNRKKKP